ncbi:DNA polymerase III subunit gamma/tau [Labrys wisconsinensis]|uniref:DNA polymerase III subunit gamma/tau n=1 Tax=Labrys wisconsinensis TaxID=425677 RepID=A0ABU0J0Z2_9HYPH|nr:DNA polymerase III subunit gamma/tau [Labrys wisconsinensis]MDQ0467936.1 DNA polymerase-3 subunit gamma/tau [Labrys wisconsinensis]
MDDATRASTGAAEPYRVLARKYRPQTFDDLIGQEAMVRTLSNAFETGRIHQAYMLTGVRGVGKTTTARILARGLNYEPDEGGGKPTIVMPRLGRHCQAIIESRHIDVLELDAASHNGVGDIRDITDSVRYAPVSARFKVLIMDEVHMVTNQAFNALLKTLEEPPPHVKFIFATTEIRKVPITILSRCQRFDLRRVDAGVLTGHLASICAREEVEVEPEALAMIARAAEGSVRDSLSLLDQAIAHAGGRVEAEGVRAMLGLADRARIIDLFEAVMRGDAAAALGELRAQYDQGADPAVVLSELAEFAHFVTRLKVTPEAGKDPAVTETERRRAAALVDSLSMKVLTRLWQMLLKGIGEVQTASKPLAAADMVLVRLCYAADLPTPDDLIRQLAEGGGPARTTGGGAAPPPPAGGGSPRAVLAATNAAPRPVLTEAAPATRPARALAGFAELVALATEKRDLPLKLALERFVRLVAFEDGRIDIALEAGAPATLVNDLSRKLSDWTERRWLVVISGERGAPTLREQAEARQAEVLTGVRADPLVRAVLERFPGAQIVDVRDNAPLPAPVVARAPDEVGDDGNDFDDADDYSSDDI